MVSVIPGPNLFVEAIEKTLRNHKLRFLWRYQKIRVLDEGDVKTHTCWFFFFKSKTKVTRIIADIDCEPRYVVVYKREDLEFAKRLAEDIASASGVTIGYDLHELPLERAAYNGCCHDRVCCSESFPLRKSLS